VQARGEKFPENEGLGTKLPETDQFWLMCLKVALHINVQKVPFTGNDKVSQVTKSK